MTLTSVSRIDAAAEEADRSDLGSGRALVLAVLLGAGLWTLIVSVALALWT